MEERKEIYAKIKSAAAAATKKRRNSFTKSTAKSRKNIHLQNTQFSFFAFEWTGKSPGRRIRMDYVWDCQRPLFMFRIYYCVLILLDNFIYYYYLFGRQWGNAISMMRLRMNGYVYRCYWSYEVTEEEEEDKTIERHAMHIFIYIGSTRLDSARLEMNEWICITCSQRQKND